MGAVTTSILYRIGTILRFRSKVVSRAGTPLNASFQTVPVPRGGVSGGLAGRRRGRDGERDGDPWQDGGPADSVLIYWPGPERSPVNTWETGDGMGMTRPEKS